MDNKKPRQKTNQKPKGFSNNVALRRIAELFIQANLCYKERPDLSKKYIALARKIAMKHKVKFTKSQKMQYCKQCGAYLIPGANSTIRASRGKLIIHCNECKSKHAFVYKR